MQRKNEVRTLSIRQWCDMVEAGNSIPVNIQLYGASMQPLVRRLKDTVTIVPQFPIRLSFPLQVQSVNTSAT